jgi:hypothetical protein
MPAIAAEALRKRLAENGRTVCRAQVGPGIGLFEHDFGKYVGPLFISVVQFVVVYLLHRSVRIMPQTERG